MGQFEMGVSTIDLNSAASGQVTVPKKGRRKAEESKIKEIEEGLSTKDIVFRGTDQIVLPNGTTIDDAIALLERKKDEEEGRIEIVEQIPAFPWDGARAFQKALGQKYQVTYKEKMTIDTPFGPFTKLPEQRVIDVDFGKTETVAWGQFGLPGVSGFVKTDVAFVDGMIVFCIRANVLQKHEEEIKELAELTRKNLREDSLYRGKAFSIKFDDEYGRPNPLPEPKFMNVDGLDPIGLIYTRNVEAAISTNVWVPIERTEECRKHSIPLKRGILLYGDYGTGKTLAAYHTAKRARENGWTFIYIHSGDDLPRAIKLAQQYQPAVIFCEDIDSVMRGERDLSMNDILNAIDGIENKNSEIIVVLTSNHVSDIHKAMLRPGRIDAAIEVTAPDAEAAERLIRHYAGPSLAPDADLVSASQELDGEIPAIIAETVEKAKLYSLSVTPAGGELKITGSSLIQAALTMRAQRGMLRREDEPYYGPQERASLLFANTLVGGIATILREFFKK